MPIRLSGAAALPLHVRQNGYGLISIPDSPDACDLGQKRRTQCPRYGPNILVRADVTAVATMPENELGNLRSSDCR